MKKAREVTATAQVAKSNRITVSIPPNASIAVAITGVRTVTRELEKDCIPLTLW